METVATVLQKACEKAGLKAEKCFLLLRRITTPGESHVPCDNEVLQPKVYIKLRRFPSVLYFQVAIA